MQLTAVKNTRKSLGLSIITADVCSPQIKKQYLSVSTTHKALFTRHMDKTEANIRPEVGGLITMRGRKKKLTEAQAYEKQINARFFADSLDGSDVKSPPKVSFTSKEMFEETDKLCQ